jgi:hypothetical protein
MFSYLKSVISKDDNASAKNYCAVLLTTFIAIFIILIAISTVLFHQPHDTALGLLLGTGLIHSIFGRTE